MEYLPDGGPTVPIITRAPLNQSVPAGATVTYNVEASGTSPLNYQWQLNGTNLFDGEQISGANTATLTLTNVTTAQAGRYTVVVTNAVGSVTSPNALLTTLTLAEAVDAPALTMDVAGDAAWIPQAEFAHDAADAARSGVITNGQNTRLETWVEGPGTVSFWWKVSSEQDKDQLRFYVGSIEQARISGEMDWRQQTFAVPAGIQLLKWRYSKDDANTGGRDAAWVDQVQYTPAVTVAPLITTQPANQRVGEGAAVSFTVEAAGTAPLSYQWQRAGMPLADGGSINGATTATLMLNDAQAVDAGHYSVVVSNASGMTTSAQAVLTVLTLPNAVDAPYLTLSMGGDASWIAQTKVTHEKVYGLLTVSTPPDIVTEPLNLNVQAGSNVVFSVEASGTAPLTYQWRFNGMNLNDGGSVGGATTPTLTLGNAQAEQAGAYSVMVANAVGSVASADAHLAVFTPPQITSSPLGQSVSEGATVSFTVAASGTPPLSYQWWFNGEQLVDGGSISGATTPHLIISNVRSAHAGAYTVVVSNAVRRRHQYPGQSLRRRGVDLGGSGQRHLLELAHQSDHALGGPDQLVTRWHRRRPQRCHREWSDHQS